MAALELKYDSQFVGAKAIAVRDGAQLTTGVRDSGTVYSVNKNDYTYLTGYYYFSGGYIYAQTIGGFYLINPDGAWDFVANATKIREYSDSSAQRLVNNIIYNNFHILQNNLVCARYATLFTPSQREDIRALQDRLQRRNKALLQDGIVQVEESSYPDGYAAFEPYLSKLMSGEGIGVAGWLVVVIVAAVIAGMGTAAYYAYKDIEDESEKDIKYSKKLMAVLAEKLTPEEYEQLLQETKGIVTKAKIKQAAGSYWNILKYAAFAAVGFVGYKILQKYVVSSGTKNR